MISQSESGKEKSMAIEVFNRYEKKYMLDGVTYRRLLKKLDKYMVPDAYNQNGDFYSISNIYYDTEDNYLIRNSIEGPVYKEKLRLRSYGIPQLQDFVFIEIKKKYEGVVNKRRTAMRLCDAYEYLNHNVQPDFEKNGGKINRQVLREIDYFKDFYGLVPKVCLSYDRKAFFEKNDGDFRVTFDTNIRTRRVDLSLEHGNYGEQLLKQDTYLMEIKISGAVPVWFTKIISELNIYPVSFSKYGTEYKKYVYNNYKKINENKGEKLCLNQYLLPQLQRMPSVLANQC